VGTRDAAQGLADRWMPGVQRLLGDPVGTGDGSDTPPQCWQRVAEAGGGQVGWQLVGSGRLL